MKKSLCRVVAHLCSLSVLLERWTWSGFLYNGKEYEFTDKTPNPCFHRQIFCEFKKLMSFEVAIDADSFFFSVCCYKLHCDDSYALIYYEHIIWSNSFSPKI